MAEDEVSPWAAAGIDILGIGLIDVLLTALNHDDSWFIAIRFCGVQWH
jgi:hypothetical protein